MYHRHNSFVLIKHIFLLQWWSTFNLTCNLCQAVFSKRLYYLHAIHITKLLWKVLELCKKHRWIKLTLQHLVECFLLQVSFQIQSRTQYHMDWYPHLGMDLGCHDRDPRWDLDPQILCLDFCRHHLHGSCLCPRPQSHRLGWDSCLDFSLKTKWSYLCKQTTLSKQILLQNKKTETENERCSHKAIMLIIPPTVWKYRVLLNIIDYDHKNQQF